MSISGVITRVNIENAQWENHVISFLSRNGRAILLLAEPLFRLLASSRRTLVYFFLGFEDFFGLGLDGLPHGFLPDFPGAVLHVIGAPPFSTKSPDFGCNLWLALPGKMRSGLPGG